ncbi:MAG: FAD-dependent oxidoreductase [Corynebacterium sp.]|nr:FAD-dependent oxidoreductase [Corynebacterium sp.]
MTTTVIVGGVAGGMSCATRLRRNDETMEIIVLEGSGYVSFANCGLPYYIGGNIAERPSLLLQTPQSLAARFHLDVHTNSRVTRIDPAAQTVTVSPTTGEPEYTLGYDNLVLSPGASPITPPIPGIERALSLRTVEDTDAIMAQVADATTAVVIGGGFIGLELAENLHERGLTVTVVEAADHVLGMLDPEMAALVTAELTAHEITVRARAAVTQITDTAVVAGGEEIPADLVIAAIGVQPASELARVAGLAVGERGGIVTDEFLRTSDPHIYALGDAAEKIDAGDGTATVVPLAQTANRHGRLVADIIAGTRKTPVKPVLGTAIIGLFDIAAASVGWSERTARKKAETNPVMTVAVAHIHPGSHAGYYPGAETVHLKLVFDAGTGVIYGAQAVGKDGVDKRIDVIATAMRGGLTASDLADLELAYAPQFGSAKDPINFLGMVADNMLHGEKTFQWYEVGEAQADGWTLVDVRDPGEVARGAIPGAINVPLNSLRAYIAEHPEVKEQKLLVNCQVGLRGHIATTLLTNSGITAANLDGGYATWRAATHYLC